MSLLTQNQSLKQQQSARSQKLVTSPTRNVCILSECPVHHDVVMFDAYHHQNKSVLAEKPVAVTPANNKTGRCLNCKEMREKLAAKDEENERLIGRLADFQAETEELRLRLAEVDIFMIMIA